MTETDTDKREEPTLKNPHPTVNPANVQKALRAIEALLGLNRDRSESSWLELIEDQTAIQFFSAENIEIRFVLASKSANSQGNHKFQPVGLIAESIGKNGYKIDIDCGKNCYVLRLTEEQFCKLAEINLDKKIAKIRNGVRAGVSGAGV